MKPGRNRMLAVTLTGAAVAAFLAAVAALVLPAGLGRAAGWAAVGVVAAAPLMRLVWLAVRWRRRGDRRFAAAAGGLVLLITAVVTVTAWAS